MQDARSASNTAINERPIAGTGANGGTGGTRPTSLLRSPWLQWVAQTVDSSEGVESWQPCSTAIGTAISANAIAAIEHAG